MTHAQTLALFQCLRRALLMIVRHLETLMEEMKKADAPTPATVAEIRQSIDTDRAELNALKH
jgi:hypothetical protein